MNFAAPVIPAPEFWTGDALACLELVASNSIDCIVTSPPYWGLRNYNCAGQIGLESMMAEYLATVVAVCRELRRVLKPDGTFWLVVGDCYTPVNRGENARPRRETMTGMQIGNPHSDIQTRKEVIVGLKAQRLKSKDLMMIPNRLAILLQDDGWWVRSEIVWAKPNPMPESVTDRPTNCHEKIWLLAKSAKYYYDAAAIRNPPSAAFLREVADGYAGSATKDFAIGGAQQASVTKSRIIEKAREKIDKQRGHGRRHAGFNDRWDALSKDEQMALGSNARNVWTISPKPFKGAHFATFPPDLVERCILAGCPPGGLVLDCFSGAGTTAMVAARLGRRSLNFEINPDYVALARERVAAARPLQSR